MRSFENGINPEHIMTEVYSYPFPEVRQAIGSMAIDPSFMLNTIDIEQAADMVAAYNFSPKLELPSHADGVLNLDELHVPVIERIRRVQEDTVVGLENFAHSYPTHGSSQALFNLMAEWKACGELESVAVLRGEYEGYGAYADALRLPVTQYDNLEDARPKTGEVWFASNPSAVDGNWLDKEVWDDFVAAGNEIVYDAAYVGLTTDRTIDVSAPNIKAVLTSPSKQFGVFRYRNTGVTYTREPVSSMYGTKWFKDVPALLDTLKLYETFGMHDLPRAYQPVQRLICQALSELAEDEVAPSDVLLLAHASRVAGAGMDRYRRANGYRFGLTKLFEDYENLE
jgi:hypothetical protein